MAEPKRPKIHEDVVQMLVRWRDDPVAFVDEAFSVELPLETWQKEELEALAHEDRIAIRSGHGVGKTFFLAISILWFALTRYPYKIPCTAPSASNLESALWPEVSKRKQELHPFLGRMLELTSSRLTLKSSNGTSFAEARTSRKEQPEALQGFHEDNLLFIVDEASGVDDTIFEVGSGSLSSPGAKMVLTGNPTRTSGYFYNAFHPRPGERKWRTRRVSCYESTRVDPTWIAEMASRYGVESREFRVRVLGEFPETDSDSFIPPGLIVEAQARRKLIELPTQGNIIWGIDVGWQGDRSALAKRMGTHLLEPVMWWSQLDPMQTTGKIVHHYESQPEHAKPCEIVIDVLNMGAGVYARLKEELPEVPITPLNVSSNAQDKERFTYLRQELWDKVREWFFRSDVTLPEDENLVNELMALDGKFHSSGRFYVVSKEATRSKLKGASPDIIDAFMHTFAASSRWDRVLRPSNFAMRGLALQTDRAYNPLAW